MACVPEPDPLEDSSGDERPKWDNKLQYLLSCVGFAVGLGNIWRFPYLCQSHGGGAFLIPYFIALALEGIPLFHIELAIGQRLRKGSIGVWTTISPYLGGVGLGGFTVSFIISLYYNTVLTWVLWYLLNSFQHPLPWSSCPLNLNRTGFVEECQGSSPVNYFWYRQTLNITADMDHSGSVQWQLLVCLAACWAVLYLCVIRGIESTGKAIYFTALFPYLVLTIFLIRGLTLPGAAQGLTYLFTPNMQTLQSPRVWLDAATQIFFSLSLAFGGHIALASYNPPRNILSLTNEFDFPDQSISRDDYVAVLTHLNATQPEKVARLHLESCHLQDFLDKSASGTGLAFIIFAEAILHMPGAPVWAVLFFVMLFTLGLSSMFGYMESIITPLLDMKVLPKWVPKEVLTGAVCLVCFLLSTCFTLQSGSYWLEVFDNHVASLNLIIFAFFEVAGVIYVYGLERFCDDIAWMTGKQPGLYWRVTWKVVSPLLLLTIFVAYIIFLARTTLSYKAWNPQYKQFPLREEKSYPGWVKAVCGLLSFLPLLWIPGVALAQLFARRRRKQENTWQDVRLA
ncbi:inactive sodium-dependent neutral amino acid transporter B(0)AT3 isoform X2 [Saccopteryx leptura]|uniref:inactive sodium-dependent neutral amino acid transporter B(0)AT3 isoform X2 n=1 Tax=Saccopteryx leptura TaxID=249018 RepID=UPI00339BA6B1